MPSFKVRNTSENQRRQGESIFKENLPFKFSLPRKSAWESKRHRMLLNNIDDECYSQKNQFQNYTAMKRMTKRLKDYEKEPPLKRMQIDHTISNFVKENFRKYKGRRNNEISLQDKLKRMYVRQGNEANCDLKTECTF